MIDMYKVIWSTEAENDFLEIIQYYMEEVSETFARRLSSIIESKINSLDTFPNRTRIGREENTRELIIDRYPYIAIIKVDEENKEVLILNIIHTSKKYP